MDKTELLWAGTRRSLFPSLQIAVDVITPKQHVRVLGVISADLSLKSMSPTSVHLASVIFVDFDTFGGRSPRSLRRHFVTSRVDYCNVVLAGAAKVINKLQRVVNAAARVLTGTRKFDRGLTQLMHDNLHWLDVPECVKYKVVILTRRCLIGTAPRYLATDCVLVSEVAQRRHLRSASSRHQLFVLSELM